MLNGMPMNHATLSYLLRTEHMRKIYNVINYIIWIIRYIIYYLICLIPIIILKVMYICFQGFTYSERQKMIDHYMLIF